MYRRRLALATTTLVSAIGACVATWPLIGNLAGATLRSGDTWLSAWQLNWYQHALLKAPLAWADANIYFPYDNAAAVNDLLLTHALITLPAAAFASPVLAHNLAFLVGIVLCGVCAHLLVVELTDAPWAAAVSGILFALTPFRFLHMGHLSVAAFWSVPLLLWALLRCLRNPTWGRAVLVAACGVATVLSSLYNPIYVAPLLPLMVLLGARRSSRAVQAWLPLLVAGAAGLLVLTPFVVPFFEALQQFGVASAPGDLGRYAADLSSLAQRPLYLGGPASAGSINPEALLYPGVSLALLSVVAAGLALAMAWGISGSSRALVVATVVTGLLALAGAATAPSAAWREAWKLLILSIIWAGPAALVAWAFFTLTPSRPTGPGVALRFGIAGAALSFALALGPEAYYLTERIGPAPYVLLSASTRLFEGARVPARFGSLVVLFLAVAAGGALSQLQVVIDRRWPPSAGATEPEGGARQPGARAPGDTGTHRRARGPVLAATVGILVVGGAFWELPAHNNLIPLPPLDEPVYDWLAEQPESFGVLELPEYRAWRALRYMLASKRHDKQLVNGAGRITPMLWRQFLDLEAWAPPFFEHIASYFPVRYVIVHEDGLPEATRGAGQWRDAAAASGWIEAHRAGAATVFSVDRSFGAGTFVDRVYLRRDLAPSARVRFSARRTASVAVTVDLFQNAELAASWSLDQRWGTFEVEIPVAPVAPLTEDPWPRAATLLTWQLRDGNAGTFELRDITVTPAGQKP